MHIFFSIFRERTRNTGIISCTVCLEEFQTPITCILSILWLDHCIHLFTHHIAHRLACAFVKKNIYKKMLFLYNCTSQMNFSLTFVSRSFRTSGCLQWLDRCMRSSQSVAVVPLTIPVWPHSSFPMMGHISLAGPGLCQVVNVENKRRQITHLWNLHCLHSNGSDMKKDTLPVLPLCGRVGWGRAMKCPNGPDLWESH